MNQHIASAIKALGSGAGLAREIGRSPQFVSQLLSGARQVPAEVCPLIERSTGGLVRCEHLRPDVAWSVLRSCSRQCASSDANSKQLEPV